MQVIYKIMAGYLLIFRGTFSDADAARAFLVDNDGLLADADNWEATNICNADYYRDGKPSENTPAFIEWERFAEQYHVSLTNTWFGKDDFKYWLDNDCLEYEGGI